MPPLDLDVFHIAMTLAAALDAAEIPYAIGGAIAFGVWADPRGTHDVDLNLFIEPDLLSAAVAVLNEAGVVLDPAAALASALDEDVVIGSYQGVRIDIFTPTIPFSWEAGRTRVQLDANGQTAWFLSAEATAVFKLLFFRAKDCLDLEKLVFVQGEKLDRAYIRRWLVEMMGEDDERVEFWDRIVSVG